MKTIILSILLLIACNINNSYRHEDIPISEIRESKFLDYAIEVNVNKFFKYRMANTEAEKVQGNHCEIIHENNDYVYFGYPIEESKFIDVLYKVKKESLEKVFPKYKTIEGYMVKSKAFEYSVEKKIKNWERFKPKYTNVDYSIQLHDTNIKVYVDYKAGAFLFRRRIEAEVLLNQSSLDSIFVAYIN